jgi:hypothetical protein
MAFASLDDMKTPAELSDWERTTSSQEVLDYLVELIPYGEGKLRLEYIARTVQGRLQPLLVIGDPAPKDPSEVPSDKAIVLVNCNIHSGEVEGKEAMLIFAREVAQGKHDDLLKDIVILLNPNMSPDGNDNLGKWRRNSQFSPKLVGTRDNGQGYNINRDMTKLDAYESRAMVEVMNKWDPVIFIDAHATNGSYMQHAVTYNWGLHPNTDPDIMMYNRGEFSSKAVGRRSYLYDKLDKVAIPYGNFYNYTNKPYAVRPDDDPYFPGELGGWITFEDYPRYTTNYAGLRNRLALLLEVYSYDPFETRVKTQYACIYGALKTIAGDKVKIKTLIAQADERSLSRAQNGVDDEEVTLNSRLEPLKGVKDIDEIDFDGKVTVQSYETENESTDPDADIVPEFVTAKDGDGDETEYRVDIVYPPKKVYEIPYYGKFVPTATRKMGALYVIRPGGDKAAELLIRHGIEVKRLTQDVEVDTFEWFKTGTMNPNPNLYEGHHQNRVEGEWKKSSDLKIPQNSYVVSTAQKNGSLAALLLEPECVDGMVAWNVLDNQIYNESTRYDEKFRTQDSKTNQWIVMPIWKFSSYDAIPASALESMETLPHDETLPPPVEYTSGTTGSSGCDAGLVGTLGIVVAAAAFAVRKFKKRR